MYERAWELLDEPIADTSLFPSLLVAKRAGRDVKVVMTGEGGDELFFGYERYGAFPTAGRARKLSVVARLHGVLRRPNSELYLQFLRPVLRRLSHVGALWRNDLLGAYGAFATIDGDFTDSRPLVQYLAKKYGMRQALPVSFFDEALYLPDDLLYKTDFATMAYSIEGRVPILDRHVYEYAHGLPPESRLNEGVGKSIVKEYLKQNLPRELIFRQKEGFSVPKSLKILERHEAEVLEAIRYATEMNLPLSRSGLKRLATDASFRSFIRARFPTFLFSLLAFHKVARKYQITA